MLLKIEYPILFYFCFVSAFVSAFMYVCPEQLISVHKLVKYRYDFLCNMTNTECLLKEELFKDDTYSRSIIIFHNGEQWKFLKQLVYHLSFCNVQHIIVNAKTINAEYLPECSSKSTTIVYSLTNLVLEFFHQEVNDSSCAPIPPSTYPLLEVFSSICPNTLWFTGSNVCDQQFFTTATKLLNNDSNDHALEDPRFERENIKNRNLVIGVQVFEPYVTKTKLRSGEFVYGGALIELFDKIASNLQFTYSITQPADGFYGGFVNGSWNGLIKQLITEETDVAVADFTATYARNQAIDFSSSFYFESIGILIRGAGSESKLWNMFMLFTLDVWFMILGCSFFSMCILFMLHRLSAIPYDSQFNNFGHCAWFVISCLTNQGCLDDHESWSSQNFMSFWWLSVFALLSAYSGGLMAMLTIGRRPLPFEDLDGLTELMKQGKYKACIHANTAFHAAIQAGDYGILKPFLEQNPSYATTREICPEFVIKEENVAYIDEVTSLAQAQKRYCKEQTLIILNDRFFPGFFAFGFRKNSMYNAIISQQITSAVDAGLIEGWKLNFTTEITTCKISKPDDLVQPNTNALTLTEVTGPFVLFCIGFICCLLAFFMELMYRRFCTRNDRVLILSNSTEGQNKIRFHHRQRRNKRLHNLNEIRQETISYRSEVKQENIAEETHTKQHANSGSHWLRRETGCTIVSL